MRLDILSSKKASIMIWKGEHGDGIMMVIKLKMMTTLLVTKQKKKSKTHWIFNLPNLHRYEEQAGRKERVIENLTKLVLMKMKLCPG